MKVSIITSCYNREATIRDTIESVLSQNYSDIEYIVVDAASKDGTMKVIDEYRDSIAKVICEPDGGMYEGINKGLKAATGDIVGLLHSDDFFYAEDTIRNIVHQFEETHADLIYGNGLYINHQRTERVVRNWISGTYSKKKVGRGWLPLHPTVYVTKEWLNQCGLYDESYKIAADSEWLVRSLHELQPNVSYLNQYIVRMRMGGLSTNPKRTTGKWKEDLRLYRSHHISPYVALCGKVTSKIPQFITARFIHDATSKSKSNR